MLNGVIISVLGLQPFVVTLATWSIVEGVALIVLPSEGGTVPGGLVRGRLLDACSACRSRSFLLLVLIAWWAWFSRTRLASRIRAAGSNERSAFLNRVSLTRHQRRGLRAVRPLRGARRLVLRDPDRRRLARPSARSTSCRPSPPW